MDFLRKHFEKLILGFMLLVLIVSVMMLLHSFQATRKKVRDAEEDTGRIVMRGNLLELIKVPSFTALKALEDPGLKLSIIAADSDDLKGSLLEPPRYIVCANPECRNLIPFKSKYCPICGEEQPPEKEGMDLRDDEDHDGIDNFFEKRHEFLSPRNPADARYDQDRDTFLNVEEYRAGTALDDPTSFPPLAENLRIVKTFRRRVPLGVKRISRNNSDDPKRWDVSLLVPDKRRRRMRTRLLAIGKSINGYVITDARFETAKDDKGKETEIPVVTVKDEKTGDEYELRPGKTTYQKTLYGHFIFLNSRLVSAYRSRRLMQFARKEGDELRLPHRLSRTIQTYKIIKLAQGKDGPEAEVQWLDRPKADAKEKEAAGKAGAAGKEKSGKTDKKKDKTAKDAAAETPDTFKVKRFNPREDLVFQLNGGNTGMGMGNREGGEMMMEPGGAPGMELTPGGPPAAGRRRRSRRTAPRGNRGPGFGPGGPLTPP